MIIYRRDVDLARFGLRIAVLLLGAVVVLSPMLNERASAKEWWEGFGFGYSDQTGPSNAKDDKPDPRNDLRKGGMPLLSDEMLISMDRAIEHYQRIVSKGGWPMIPGNRSMRPNDDDERMPALRKRLAITRDLRNTSYMSSYSYDSDVVEGVRRFQARHGLRESGRVDRPTLAALKVSAAERLDQLRLNRTRLADLIQKNRARRYVLVNVPGYQLEAVDNFQVELRHRVIVGRQGRETPSLSVTIRAMNFFPYWRVPDSVARLDLIPKLQSEPQYLAEEKIRVHQDHFNGLELDASQIDWTQADYKKIKFKQDPGEQNALGLVRLDMPNSEGVYMHDTPLKKLFGQATRAFSAGCVRVQGVFKLAEWIARYEAGFEQPGRVEQILAAGQAVDVELKRPVPVIFGYVTAWAEQNGMVQFRADIYNRDGHQALSEFVDPDAPPPSAGLAP